MKTIISALATICLLIPATSSANETSAAASKCSARAIEKFYCPTSSGWWYGPYFDNGCSVKCSEGQKAVCEQATCDSSQSGEAVPSSCTCE